MIPEILIPGLKNGDLFPKTFTCVGSDISPALRWGNFSENVVEYALIMDDPDAPSGLFTHWIIYGLKPEMYSLPENVPKTLNLPFGGIQGKNDFGKMGYGGPCPPRGKPHRYYFRLFGLLTPSGLGKSVTRKEFDKAINGKYSEKAEFMLMFSR